MQALKTILCPLDFTPVSEREVQLAAELSERTGAQLVLLHNLDAVPPAFLGTVWMHAEAHPEARPEAQAAARLQEALSHLPPAVRARAEGKITHGTLADAIVYLARELPADLIVMGTHDHKGPEPTSHTDRIVLQSPCPVLAVRDREGQPRMPHLSESSALATVVPMDFSPHSLHALEYALELSQVLPLEIHVLHVESSVSWNDVWGAPRSDLAESRRGRLRTSKERLQALIPARFGDSVSVEARLGSPVEEIVTFVQEKEAGLVIMGVHAKGILDRLLFGATSKGVLHESPCPVWLVPSTVSSLQGGPHPDPPARAVAGTLP